MTITRRTFVAALATSGAAAAFAAESSSGAADTDSVTPVFVVATIEIKSGKRDEFIEIFKANVPNVEAEDGYIMYQPVIDLETGISNQAPLRDNVMTVVEKWESLDALRKHLQAPHMETYRANVKELVAGVTLHIMQPA